MTTIRGRRMAELGKRLKGRKDPAKAYDICVRFAKEKDISLRTVREYAEVVGVNTKKGGD